MKHTLTKDSPTRITLTIELDADDLASVRPLTITKLSQNLKVAGFRAGKVPIGVAAKHLDPGTVESQLIEDAVNKHVIDVLNAEELQLLDRPKVDIQGFEPGTKLEFTATAEILPEVKLGDYTTLKATPVKVAVSAKEIDEVLDRVRLNFATKTEVDRGAKDGDEAVIDFEGVDEKGVPVSGASGTDYPLSLGSNTFIPGFEQGIVGRKSGESFDLPLTFPKDYHAAALAGAKVTFKVTVKAIKEVALPPLNDELAAKVGPFATVEELRADIKRELLAQREQTELNKLKDALVEQLVKTSEVPVPDSLVEDQIKQLERDTVQNLLYRGLSLDQHLESQNLTKEDWQQKELRPAAIRRVQVGLALAELTKVEKIEISKDQLEAEQAKQLERYSDPKLRARFDTPEARRELANRLLTASAFDRLVELNTRR